MTSVDRPGRLHSSGRPAGLVCRECGATYDLGPSHVCEMCFGPLEIAYDPEAAAARSRAPRSRPARTRCGATTGCCRSRRSSTSRVGMTRLVPAPNLARELGMRSLWVKDDSGNPTHSFKDRVVAVAASAARALGYRGAGVRLDRQPGERGRGRVRELGTALGRAHPARPRGRQGRHDRDLRRDADRGRGLLRRRQPAVRRGRRRAAVGVRQRQRPAVLRRGLEDGRLRGRRAARLAAAAAGGRSRSRRDRC